MTLEDSKRLKINAERREEYQYYKEHGICVFCHREEAAKGKVACLNCLSIRSEKKRLKNSMMTKEEREEEKRKMRERSQALRDYRKANGLCVLCGKPVYKNYCTCYEHYLYHKRHSKRRNEAKKKGYAEQGLCRFCGKPTVEGSKLCAEHLEQFRERMRKVQAIRMEKLKNGK